MYKFIRYFNQNRKKIVSILTVIIFGYLLLQFINYQVAQSNKRTNVNQNLLSSEKELVNNNINHTSAITGTTSSLKQETDVIEQFIKYCNEDNVQAAYDMLSIECKENLYPTLEYFTQNYYNNNFKEKKTYKIQCWAETIFKVELKENILHSGNTNVPSKQDYITTVRNNEEYKLNINSYIGRKEINKQANIKNIDINILYKDVFMNYEIYTFKINNNGENDIYLDNLEKTSTLYVLDENNVKHLAYSHELVKEQLHMYGYSEKTVKIKFSNKYISGREYSKIVFENVIVDEQNNEKEKISINL